MDLVLTGLHPADRLGHVVALLPVLRPVVHGGDFHWGLWDLDRPTLLPREGNIVALLPGHPDGPPVLPLHQVAGPDCLAHGLHLSPSYQVLISPVDGLHHGVDVLVAGLALVFEAGVLGLRSALPHWDVLNSESLIELLI